MNSIINLDTPISKINRLTKDHAIALERLKLKTLRDLLFYFPARYMDERENSSIQNLSKGVKVVLYGEIKNLKIKRSFRGHVPMCEAKLYDNSGSIKLVWFHQAYIAKMYSENEFVKVSGTVSEKDGVFSILNSNIEKASRDHIFFENSILETIENKNETKKENNNFEIIPIYKETKGLSSNYLHTLIKKAILEYKILEQVKNEDAIPKSILENFHLPSIDKALLYIHLPKAKTKEEAEKQILAARKRFSFEEIFYIQILKQIEREKAKDSLAYKILTSPNQPLQPFGQLPQRKQSLRIFPYNQNLMMQAKENRKDMTEAEKSFWYLINKDQTGFDFTRQKVIDNFILDFYCNDLMLGIEIDGGIHKNKKEYDSEREMFLNQLGIKIIRFKNEEVKNISVEYLRKIFKKRAVEVSASLWEAPQSGEGVKNQLGQVLDEILSKIKKDFNLSLTNAQLNAIKTISQDLEKDEPMSRLLEGDVGSGKTLVAQIISYLATHNINRDSSANKKLQVAYMAPTEILATQHFESFCNFFKNSGIEIGLLTSKTSKKFPSKINKDKAIDISKAQLKKWIASGDISILIGTHSLTNESVAFQNLALAMIDEQHRFGVKQRAALANKKSSSTTILVANDIKNLTNKKQKIVHQKEKLPHLLSMTATPIPRTLALTIFGDLDLVILDELPKGRKPIETFIETEVNREKVYRDLKKEIEAGYQAYVITPRIDELDEEEMQKARSLNLRSTTSELKNLEEFFNKKEKMNISIKAIHSKLSKDEKEKIMQEFAEGKIKILVSTSLVEVGVNVPNASRMIIEGAERFGLAQLHQLRGRIGRGERESVCYLFTNSESEATAERLSSLKKAKNGFELAELDLNQRGIGSLLSGKQWGVSDLAMEAIKNLKLVEAAREEARKIITEDKYLKNHPHLSKILLEKEKAHME